MTLSFLFLSVAYFAAGLTALTSFLSSACAYLLLWLVIPSGFVFFEHLSYSGIHASDFYFLALFPVYILLTLRKHFSLEVLSSLCVFCIMLCCVYSIVYFLNDGSLDKYYLKDLRPFLHILFFIIFILSSSTCKLCIQSSTITMIVAAGCLSNIIVFTLVTLGYVGVDDLYYSANAYRYFDATSYISAIYLIITYGNWNYCKISPLQKAVVHVTAVLCILTVVASGMRILVIGLSAAVLFSGELNIQRALSSLFIVTVLIVGFLFTSYALQIERITDYLSLSRIIEQIVVRFGPALNPISSMGANEVFVGQGIATTFEIPWFAYRGLDTVHNTIDSTYLTFFVKYGIASIGVIYTFVHMFTVNANKNTRTGLIVLISALFLTTSFPYQHFSLPAIIFSYVYNSIFTISKRKGWRTGTGFPAVLCRGFRKVSG